MAETRIVTREVLDGMGCQMPGCDHTAHDGLVLHARCHLDAATWATYHDGVLTISCAVCERVIVRLAVAEAPHIT